MMSAGGTIIELMSAWAKAINPLLAGILAFLNALDVRNSRWRFAYRITGALCLAALGCYLIYRLIV
ncbi:hypothetical protein [Bradyrhizobium sp. RDM4]|uniref:hypothetical protein n=1 Tax=Bradyrhizobium sp. RDM4 TaxID=3378765 RepID=UPI0038FC0C89